MTRIARCISVFLLLIVIATGINAMPATSELAGYLNAMHSMQADFVQTTYDNHQKAIQQSYGKMSLRRPGQFRWQITKPIPQLMIANRERLWIYDEDLEQVTIRSLKKMVGETPGLLLSHVDNNLENDFTISLLKSVGNQQRLFLLKPKKADTMFAAVKMGFVNGQIKEMELSDHLGHTTKILFKKVRINPSLPAALFVFKPNSRTDIIDETR